jgi:hypothetical protein
MCCTLTEYQGIIYTKTKTGIYFLTVLEAVKLKSKVLAPDKGLFFFLVLGIELRAFGLVGRCSTTKSFLLELFFR